MIAPRFILIGYDNTTAQGYGVIGAVRKWCTHGVDIALGNRKRHSALTSAKRGANMLNSCSTILRVVLYDSAGDIFEPNDC